MTESRNKLLPTSSYKFSTITGSNLPSIFTLLFTLNNTAAPLNKQLYLKSVLLDLHIRLQTGSLDYVYAQGQYGVVYYTHTVGTQQVCTDSMRAAGYRLCLHYAFASTDPT